MGSYAQNDGSDILKGFIAGTVADLVGSAEMNPFQQQFGRLLTADDRSHGAQSLQPCTPDHGIGRMLDEEGVDDPKDDSAERLASAVSCAGMPCPAATWLNVDEGAVPLFGLSKSLAECPLPFNAASITSHLVHGLIVEAVRRGIRAAL